MKRRDHLLQKLIPIFPIIILGLLFFVFRKRLVGVFMPLIIAVLLAYMLDPAVNFVQKRIKFSRGKKRAIAVAIVFFTFVILFLSSVSFLLPTIASNIADIMESINDIQPRLTSYVQNVFSDEHPELMQKVLNIIDSFAERIKFKVSSFSESATSLSAYGRVSDVLVGIITSFVLTYYFLRDKTSILNGILGLFPYSWRNYITETANELGMISAKFIQGQFLVALIVGIIEMVGLILLRIPYGIFFGVIGGLSNMIPYFGPFFGAILPTFTALMISPSKAVWVVILFVCVQQLDNHFISPKIIQGNLGIHPITVIVLVFIGQEFFGLWGIVTIIPIYAMIKCLGMRIIKFVYPPTIQTVSLKQEKQ